MCDGDCSASIGLGHALCFHTHTCLVDVAAHEGIGEEAVRGFVDNALYLASHHGGGILRAEKLEEARAQRIGVVFHHEVRFEIFGALCEFLCFRSDFLFYGFCRFAIANHADGALLEFPHFVVETVFLLEEAVEFVVERSAAHALTHVVDLHAEVSVFNDHWHDALRTGVEEHHAYGIDIAGEAETSMYDFARVDATVGALHRHCVSRQVFRCIPQVERTSVQAGDRRIARYVVLLST